MRQNQEDQGFGEGFSPIDKANELVKIHFLRVEARQRQLPVPIAKEWTRVELCRSKDNAAVLFNTENTDPQCR